MNGRLLVTVSLILLFSTHAFAQSKLVPFNHPSISYEGRVGKQKDAAELTWSGTTATIYFKGTGINAVLKDNDTANYYNVIIDDSSISKIHTETRKKTYVLARNLPNKKHKIQLYKRTEWYWGKTLFYGFQTTGTTTILPAPPWPKRKIEFYGNSITCGYGAEDSSGNDSGKGYFENNYVSYAALTARHFKAQYNFIARSGIGVMISWDSLIMPELYDRLDAANPNSKWDFSKYTPDVVVVNLFQNDCWLTNMPDHPQFKYRFGTKAPTRDFIVTAYKNFIKQLRQKYPNAYIICALGNMDATAATSPWPGYIQQAVTQLEDTKIYAHFFDYKNTPGHPKTNEQKMMAVSLIDFIEKNIEW
jgi:Carbohydrate esterase 2 N-terminal/GDSL-like Lipase/Acylhydrolase family